MNDYVRAGIIIFTIILLFGLSYIATEHLVEVKIIEDSEAVITLTAENDSLKTLISTLTETTGVTNE